MISEVKHDVIYNRDELTAQALDNFAQVLDSKEMLVKSVTTGQVKTIDVQGKFATVPDAAVANLSIRDDRVTPKQNYTRIDPSKVNLFAHKGPDENGGITQ